MGPCAGPDPCGTRGFERAHPATQRDLHRPPGGGGPPASPSGRGVACSDRPDVQTSAGPNTPGPSNEKETHSEIAQGLEDEPEDESKSAALEHQIENELCERGTSCGATDSRASVLEHVTERAVATFEMDDRHAAKGDDIATELQNLCDPLRAANSAAAPFVIGCQPAHPGRRCSVIVGRC